MPARSCSPACRRHGQACSAHCKPRGRTAGRLRGLGTRPLAGGWRWAADSRGDVLSHLLRVSFPAPGETGADLRAAADAARVPVSRLIDLALYAPQWAVHVGEALGWP